MNKQLLYKTYYPQKIKFHQDVPPLNQQQLFEYNLNVYKYKLGHLKSRALQKKTFRNSNDSGCTQLAKRSSRKNVIRSGKIFREVQLQDLRSITKERAVVTILQIEGSFRTRVWSVPRTWPWVKVNLTKDRHVLVLSVCCSKYPKDHEVILSK